MRIRLPPLPSLITRFTPLAPAHNTCRQGRPPCAAALAARRHTATQVGRREHAEFTAGLPRVRDIRPPGRVGAAPLQCARAKAKGNLSPGDEGFTGGTRTASHPRVATFAGGPLASPRLASSRPSRRRSPQLHARSAAGRAPCQQRQQPHLHCLDGIDAIHLLHSLGPGVQQPQHHLGELPGGGQGGGAEGKGARRWGPRPAGQLAGRRATGQRGPRRWGPGTPCSGQAEGSGEPLACLPCRLSQLGPAASPAAGRLSSTPPPPPLSGKLAFSSSGGSAACQVSMVPMGGRQRLPAGPAGPRPCRRCA